MNSYILVSQSEDYTSHTEKILKPFSIDPLDIKEMDVEVGGNITEVRKIIHSVSLKPYKSSHKAIIIHSAQLLSPEAQNALLKTLEEPPLDTLIILTTPDRELLLPTIQSRCVIVEDQTQEEKLTDKEIEKYYAEFLTMFKAPIGEKMAIAQSKSKSKEDAQKWIKHVTFALQKKLETGVTEEKDPKVLKNTAKALSVLSQCYIQLGTSINTRMLLEHTFLTLPKKIQS